MLTKNLKQWKEKITKKLIEEWLLTLSTVGLIASSLYLGRFPEYTPEDLKVLFTLFVFLLIVKGLEESRLLEFLAYKVERGKFIELKILLFTFLISAFITNDVALFVVVPLSLLLNIDRLELLIILEAAAANAGSALSPFGNPQNLYLFHHYHIPLRGFMEVILPFGVATLGLLLLLWFGIFLLPSLGRKKFAVPPPEKTIQVNLKEALVFGLFFVLFALAVVRILPLWVGLIPILYAVIVNRKLLKVDYFLLLTFLTFFGLTDNLSRIWTIHFENPTQVFLYSTLASQIMSNVPAALFLSEFTNQWKALLWGVNVGGFGTLIASMANLIAYKIYLSRRKNQKGFLWKFHLVSFIFLAVGIITYLLVEKLL